MAATEEQITMMMTQFQEAMSEIKKIHDDNSSLQKQLLALMKGKVETDGEGTTEMKMTGFEEGRDHSMMVKTRTFKPKPRRPVIDSEIDDLEW